MKSNFVGLTISLCNAVTVQTFSVLGRVEFEAEAAHLGDYASENSFTDERLKERNFGHGSNPILPSDVTRDQRLASSSCGAPCKQLPHTNHPADRNRPPVTAKAQTVW